MMIRVDRNRLQALHRELAVARSTSVDLNAQMRIASDAHYAAKARLALARGLQPDDVHGQKQRKSASEIAQAEQAALQAETRFAEAREDYALAQRRYEHANKLVTSCAAHAASAA
jgi:hypothetical protein